MSAVDVLAAMDDLIRYYRDKEVLIGSVDDARSVNHHNARDTMAELVAADKAYDAAKASRIEADNRITLGDRSDDAFRRKANADHAYERAADRRHAALARINGEQA